MRKYKQLSLEDRERIYAFSLQGMSVREIAKLIGRNHSTVSREIKRNSNQNNGEYIPCKANRKAIIRMKTQREKAPLKNPEIFLYVREKIRNGWSPEIVSVLSPGRISPETIYRYIYGKGKEYKLWQFLPYGRKKRRNQNGRRVSRDMRIPYRLGISERPEFIDRREVIGHWETDLMIGKHSDKYAIHVLIERMTRYIILRKISKKALDNYENIVESLRGYPVISITSDNGLENYYHFKVSHALDCNYYFCHPYSSWEKGSVENVIKIVRRFIPKGQSIDGVNDDFVKEIEKYVNSYPRKLLEYKTPYIVFQQAVCDILKNSTSGALQL